MENNSLTFAHYTRTSQTGKTSMQWYTEIFYAVLLDDQTTAQVNRNRNKTILPVSSFTNISIKYNLKRTIGKG